MWGCYRRKDGAMVRVGVAPNVGPAFGGALNALRDDGRDRAKD